MFARGKRAPVTLWYSLREREEVKRENARYGRAYSSPGLSPSFFASSPSGALFRVCEWREIFAVRELSFAFYLRLFALLLSFPLQLPKLGKTSAAGIISRAHFDWRPSMLLRREKARRDLFGKYSLTRKEFKLIKVPKGFRHFSTKRRFLKRLAISSETFSILWHRNFFIFLTHQCFCRCKKYTVWF